MTLPLRDVRNLQALLGEGVTDPVTLWNQIDQTVVIPHDDQEHACVCGRIYRAWDNDGWLADLVVCDDEGRTVSWCAGCERNLEAEKARR